MTNETRTPSPADGELIDARGLLEGTTPGPWFYGISCHPERGPVAFDYSGPGYYDNASIYGADWATEIVGCDEYNVFGEPADVALMVAAPTLARDNIAKDAIIEAQSATIERMEELIYLYVDPMDIRSEHIDAVDAAVEAFRNREDAALAPKEK